MDVTVKVFLHKLDSSVEVRRIPNNNIGGVQHGRINGQFGLLLARIASAFPSLRNKAFGVSWKDSEGDLILMSSDNELFEALAASNGQILKVYITEPKEAMENNSTQSYGEQPRVLPTAPPQPFIEHGLISGQGQYGHGMPGHSVYPHVPEMMMMLHGGHPYPPPSAAGVVTNNNQPMVWTPGQMATNPCPAVQNSLPQPAIGDKKAWKTMLRAQVPLPHRRWAKGHIRQWRTANVENATTSTSSDCDKGPKLSREEAGVPETYVQWLDVVLPKVHKCWGKGKTGNAVKELEEIEATVPVEFQNWCHWYLKRHFGPKHKPELKDTRKNKDWKAIKKEMKKAVPREYRIWTKTFIKQWQEDHLGGSENGTSGSSSSGTESESDGEAVAREAILEEIIIPADYPRWLRKFLNFKYNNMGVALRVPDLNQVHGGMDQFKGTVPEEYRKWARSYVNHRLNKGKKCHSREAVHPTDTYQKWLYAFQRRWLEQVVGNRNLNPTCREVTHTGGYPHRAPSQVFDMEILGAAIDSSDSEEENEGPSQKEKISPDFRRWARDALNEWDGMTLPLAASREYEIAQQSGSTGQYNIPPRTLKWMVKIMTKAQMRKIKVQRRAEKQEMKAQRREAKAEKKATRQGFRLARKSLKVARQAIRYRYV